MQDIHRAQVVAHLQAEQAVAEKVKLRPGCGTVIFPGAFLRSALSDPGSIHSQCNDTIFCQNMPTCLHPLCDFPLRPMPVHVQHSGERTGTVRNIQIRRHANPRCRGERQTLNLVAVERNFPMNPHVQILFLAMGNAQFLFQRRAQSSCAFPPFLL